ncbi:MULTISPECIES: DEAD/DEAH box helicase [Streptomyces]|uniref:ATP-dependent RNA helicase RhlE n=1 Tax=Streptomyces fradiae ATCC 10745 = DSM 40063 TaxID=1319510 RepID=A0A1Y2NNG3_STRFR|nr:MULTISPECIES: DEAD/DEAH box helicase [Streptomyces]KAF0649359.1 DEAD/DEAH box helicase [Streptomyces fradiae ATCC 10745 = DSM 40063]OSY49035.1 ATP-dependent RNA helicase RhlE [Streptomyces fradiae ATCC 10745 = DSM 40063]QEV14473.1 DEAD/DEAH box helicase [Streptomyces fradiae ATCC 10745 = DSM 40063]
MNRTRTNDRFARTRNGGADAGRGGSRFGAPRPNRSGASSRPGGHGRRPAAVQGEFALPETLTPALSAVAAFADLDMPRELLAALGAQGVTVPFPIQAATLPNSLAGRDVLGRGRTGSGKTLAFGLALLARTAGQRAEARQPLGLVLVPTRELAQQVTDALTPYARSVRLRLATVVGGMPIGRQASALRGGAEIVVATPGRLKDLIERGDCRLDQVRVTVLDEADQMADMGFMPQVTALVDQVRPEGQRMLFSATLDRNVDLLVRRYLSDPVVHSVDPSAGAVTTMEHHVLHVHGADKHTTTTEIAARDGRVIMFLDTKHAVDRLTEHLLNSGVRAAALHGGKSQPQRTRTLTQFKTGHVNVLVATNVVARGIHVDRLDLVVNVDPPTDHKDYLHRGGRTARAGESGSVVTLVTPSQRRSMTRLLTAAGIVPQTTQVRAGGEALHRITGAQAPSGVPVVITAPVAERTGKRGAASRGRRRPASASRRASGRQSTVVGTAA